MKFIESIRVEEGSVQDLVYHNRRVARTISSYWRDVPTPDLDRYCEEAIKREGRFISKGVFKLRIIYTDTIISHTIEPYYARQIKSLKIVEDNNIDYSFKFEDRGSVETLFKLREQCDDVLIVKNGFITDTSYCNIIFEKDGILYTPDSPLLAGTKREKFLERGMILEKKIRPCDIKRYDKVYLINSMLNFTPVEEIVF